MKLTHGILGLALVGLCAACSPKEVILQGQRLDVRTPLSTPTDEAAKPADTAAPRNVPVHLPGQVVNADWTARGGDAAHHMARQPALGAPLSPLWVAPIGAGEDRRHTITADPVVAGGRIFTLDAQARVTATSTAGATLWALDLTPSARKAGDASGGGLAYGDGTLFVTSAFGELVAVDPASGKPRWRQKFDAPVTSAPTIAGNTVLVTARDGTAWAIDAANGRVRWQLTGSAAVGGLTGGAAPAVSGGVAVLPFSSEQLVGVRLDGGLQLWNTHIAGRRLGHVYAMLSDIVGDPVIVGSSVYVGNASGRVAAYDLRSGEQEWESSEGTMGPVTVAGDAVYLVSDASHLVRLNAATGAVVWKAELPYYLPYKKDKRRRDIYVHYGPLLAGNRLIVASSDGLLRFFDPASGALAGTVAIGAPATTDAVVAGRTLYVVTADGKLRAFR